MSLKSKIQALITAANAKTGETDATLTDAVQTLVDGYGQGGGTPVIQPLSITENGTYTAPEGVDGYSPVTVNVSGGGGFLKERGEITLHSGSSNRSTIGIPVSDATKSHYLVITKAKSLWVQEDGVWVERDGLDASGYTSGGQFIVTGAVGVYPIPQINIMTNGSSVGNVINYSAHSVTTALTNPTSHLNSVETGQSVQIKDGEIRLTASQYWEKSTMGCTHEYTVIGWD